MLRLMFLEAKQHWKNSETRFYTLQNTKKGKADVFPGKIEGS